jgi:DNA primase
VDLESIANFYHKALAKSPEASAYLESRGLTDKKLWSRFQIGYADGSLPDVLSSLSKESLTNCRTSLPRRAGNFCIAVL